MRPPLLRISLTAAALGIAFPAFAEGDKPAEPAVKKPLFPPTPLVDIAGRSDFPNAAAINDEAATQLPGLSSLKDFSALPSTDRFVYSLDPWPAQTDALGEPSYAFNFKVGQPGLTTQKVSFTPTGGGAGSGKSNLTRVKSADGSFSLQGFGNLSWGGNLEQSIRFDKPVRAFGVVVRSSSDMDLRRFYWQAAKELNGYPLSYTLSDGSVVNLGAREVSGAKLPAETDAFLGVIDKTGIGIVSVNFTLKGLAGNKHQGISVKNLAFATMPRPAVAPLINLRGSCDFYYPDTIAAQPQDAVAGLASLDEFRFIVGNKRYVYHCDTWPKNNVALGTDTGEFAFDLRGKGQAGQKLTVTAKSAAKDAKLLQTTLNDADALPYKVLGGLGDIGKGAASEQTYKFTKPVWAFGVTVRSPQDINLAKTGTFPVSYTLGDGTVVNLGKSGDSGGTITANTKTFIGLRDTTDKGITSVTLRLQGRSATAQPVYVEDIAFALAGPPPGDWKLTMADEFDGDKLNDKNWAPGYIFPDVINSEYQAFVPENISVADGIATIKVEHRPGTNTDRFGRKGAYQQFASGAFTSFDKFTQTYGYFEARIKMPKARGAGVWPAFWVLPDRGKEYGMPDRAHYMTKDIGRGMEIDIFEFMPRWKRPDGTFPIHTGCIWSYGPVTEKDPAPHGYGAYALTNDGWGPQELYFPNLDTEFHTYGLYWSPERLIWYLDGKPIFRAKNPDKMPDVPHYFLFNISLSGNGWGKSTDKSHPKMEEIIADLPNAMEIDYFRAYSGLLEEAVPPAPTDIPGPVTKYKPREKKPAPIAAPAAQTPAAPQGAVPAAPANVGINTPAG